MDARKRSESGGTSGVERTARSTATIDRILSGAMRAVFERGAGKMSMLDVANMAQVSRGTLYRYFPTKERLLEAVTERLRSQFDERIIRATESHSEPEACLRAWLEFQAAYLEGGQPRRFLEIEPHFAFGYYRRNFSHFVDRTQMVLTPVFDDWERRAGVSLDRQLLAELLVRYTLSDMLVPAENRRNLAERLLKFIGVMGAG